MIYECTNCGKHFIIGGEWKPTTLMRSRNTCYIIRNGVVTFFKRHKLVMVI